MNLILNAIQAMPQGGTLTVWCIPEAEKVTLSFQDTGIGIPPEYLSKIFVPFFTTKQCGTGLGLSVVHGIVEAHHGVLNVESTVGRGARFFATFPLIRRNNA